MRKCLFATPHLTLPPQEVFHCGERERLMSFCLYLTARRGLRGGEREMTCNKPPLTENQTLNVAVMWYVLQHGSARYTIYNNYLINNFSQTVTLFNDLQLCCPPPLKHPLSLKPLPLFQFRWSLLLNF